jgi:amino acid adenylation domain-containing protein
VALDALTDALAAAPETDPLVEAHPESLAYVMFTSGSTGAPKGVMITAGNLASLTDAVAEAYGITEADRVLQFASPSFDMSVEEIYPCLARGATLVLKDAAMSASIPGLVRGCDELALSVVNLPTAYWHQLVAELASGDAVLPPSLRQLMIGGGRARPDALAQWERAAGGGPRLLNAYGPTEATVDAAVSDLSRPGLGALAEVPIGRPIAGWETYVLDARGALAATGVPGELAIGGAGIARGYFGEPALTAERFVPSGLGAVPGARLYLSGDRARYLADRELQYLGRLDTQTKIRGYRVEPAEVEAVLARGEGVREATVVAREDATGEPQLVAYVVPLPGQAPETLADALREACRETLPAYMVPASIVVLETLPLTTAGKVDVRALPAPDRGAVLGGATYAAPRTADEQTLASVWAELLGLDKVGIDDNFFDLGGHSLALLGLQRRLRRQLGRDVPVVDLFRFTTVRALARHLAAGAAADAAPTGATRDRAARQRQALQRFQRRARGVEAS